MSEIWVEIAGTDGRYSVSDLGNVRANWSDVPLRILPHRRRIEKSYLLTPYLNTNGYYRVSLGRGKKRYVHRLVAEAFIQNPNSLPCVDHINGVKTDNSIPNLRWVTQKENTLFGAERHLWAAQKKAAKSRRIHHDKVQHYRLLLNSGLSLRKIAKMNKTSHSTISRALKLYDL